MGKQINQHDSTFGIFISAIGENMEHAKSRVGKRKAGHHAMAPVGVCQNMIVLRKPREDWKLEIGNWKLEIIGFRERPKAVVAVTRVSSVPSVAIRVRTRTRTRTRTVATSLLHLYRSIYIGILSFAAVVARHHSLRRL